MFKSKLWVAVVPPSPAPENFLMFLPKPLTNLPGAEALDLSGWLMKGLRQVSGTPRRKCAATRNSLFEGGADHKGAPSPNEFA